MTARPGHAPGLRHHLVGSPARELNDVAPLSTRQITRRIFAAAVLASVIVSPSFLVGAVGFQLRADLGLTAGAFGLVVSIFHLVRSVLATPLGMATDRFGSFIAMRAAVVGSFICLAGIGLLAGNWLSLALFLAIGGAANSLGTSGINRYFTQAVPTSHHGVAFAAKHAAPPLATLLGGVLVPTVVLTIGWRAGFVMAAAAAVAVLGHASHRRIGATDRVPQGSPPPQPPSELRLGVLALLALTVFLGFGVTAGMTAFFVEAMIGLGVRPWLAGLIFAGGSVSAIALRVLVGLLADRRQFDPLTATAYLLLAGAGGYPLLASRNIGWLVVGTLLVFAAGWGYNGIFYLGVVRSHPTAPATASGIVMTGGAAGGVAGPLVFGLVIQHLSYETAWYAALAASLAAVGACVAAKRLKTRPATVVAP